MPTPLQAPNGQEFPFSLTKGVHLHFVVADLPDHHGLAVLSLTPLLKPFCFFLSTSLKKKKPVVLKNRSVLIITDED